MLVGDGIFHLPVIGGLYAVEHIVEPLRPFKLLFEPLELLRLAEIHHDGGIFPTGLKDNPRREQHDGDKQIDDNGNTDGFAVIVYPLAGLPPALLRKRQVEVGRRSCGHPPFVLLFVPLLSSLHTQSPPPANECGTNGPQACTTAHPQ